MIRLLLHFELDDGVGVGGSGGAACRSCLYGEREHGAGGVILRDGAGVVGRGGNGHVLSGRAVGQPHDGVRRAARWRGLGLDLNRVTVIALSSVQVSPVQVEVSAPGKNTFSGPRGLAVNGSPFSVKR